MERTDTRNFFIEEGTYLFEVLEVKKEQTPKKKKRVYNFKFKVFLEDGTEKEYRERFAVWQVAPLLRALKCREVEEGVFEWELDEVVGRRVWADLYFEESQNGKSYLRMSNIRAEDEVFSDDDNENIDEEKTPF